MPADWEQKVLAARRISLETDVWVDNFAVDPTQSYYFYIDPGVGYIGTLTNLDLQIHSVSGASSGEHVVYLKTGSLLLAIARSNYNSEINLRLGVFEADVDKFPEDTLAQFLLLNGGLITFDHDTQLTIQYTNQTDVQATQQHIIRPAWLKEEVYS